MSEADQSAAATSRKKLSPTMQQFFRAKEQAPDAILFFRIGDFYEMFFEDAVRASAMLDITLTARGVDADGEKIPLAGVPHHAASGYVAKLLELGQRVAICEQMADPKTVKGVVPREIVRVVSPGLCLDPDSLDARADNYLVSLAGEGTKIGLAAFELTTAELRACVVDGTTSLLAELVRLEPREILIARSLAGDLEDTVKRALPRSAIRLIDGDGAPDIVHEALSPESAAEAERDVEPLALVAASEALRYARDAQPGTTAASLGATRIARYDPTSSLVLDEVAVRNLELLRTTTGDKNGALLSLIDATRTSMGARLLRRRLVAPLTEIAAIRRRHDAVEGFLVDSALRRDVRTVLDRVTDLERLSTRAALGAANPRELASVREGLRACRELGAVLAGRAHSLLEEAKVLSLPGPTLALLEQLERELVDEPPIGIAQGAIVREGIDEELDTLRRLSSSSKDVLLEMERRERERTGIGSLKIRYTRVFGYYIEITRTKLAAVPPEYRRKQTVAGAERFVTAELEDLEAKIATADERARAIELAHFHALRKRVGDQAVPLREVARRVADIDVHAGLAEVAHRYGYVRPEMDDSVRLELEELRHPVVERLAAAGRFVPNDVTIDADDKRLMIVTGPNMAGKSTVMRQVALAVVLAQCGAFVPAQRARIGVVDRVYTRVGASDNLGRGDSTFMVEMRETATLLRESTRRSLVVLDEIGRGTSTYDGLAIAWAVAENLHDIVRCRAMFATHYHELCELEASRSGVVNVNVAAREHEGDVVFLRKLAPGCANRSYGVAVARLAGVPELVLARAKAILSDLEAGAALKPSEEPKKRSPRAHVAKDEAQLGLFVRATPKASEVEKTLAALEIERMTPLEAMVALARLKEMLE